LSILILPPTILVIDSDAAAGRELSALLLDQPGPPRLFVSLGVNAATDVLATEQIDGLFIRISQWDEYQLLVARLTHPPARVVFLSGRMEKCTGHLGFLLDAHLQPPYRASKVAKCWSKLLSPDLARRPLDFFFLKTQARYVPIRYSELKQVRRFYNELRIQTRATEYRITGSLAAFQARLPIPLARVRRGLLVNEAYEPDPPK
jgi:DNA-binding LytR/AlgR family response regulator